jgi:hypothetical protein
MNIEVKEGQTIIDLAVQLYGTAEAVARLLSLNPQLTDNDFDFDISESLTPGSFINYDETDSDKRTLKELDGKLIISE